MHLQEKDLSLLVLFPFFYHYVIKIKDEISSPLDIDNDEEAKQSKVSIFLFGEQVKPTSSRCFLDNANGPLHI